MTEHKDVGDLLDEVLKIIETLREEKTALEFRLKSKEDEVAVVKDSKNKAEARVKEVETRLGRELEEANTKFDRELQETKDRLGKELQETKDTLGKELQTTKDKLSKELHVTKEKLNQIHPEMQSLQNELQNVEVENNLLSVEISKRDEEIKAIERRLQKYTSLVPPSETSHAPLK